MSYSQINIDKFKGLNSTVAPELIDDSEARDLCNFRMEKVGKLVSRNGYIVGIELYHGSHATVTFRAETSLEFGADDPRSNATNNTIKSFIQCTGCVGMGELILERKWDVVDTDRFMVYVIRGILSPDTSDQKNIENYLFSPLSGQYKNRLILQPGVSNYRSSEPQAYNLEGDAAFLHAPNRFIPGSDTARPENENDWVEHYVKMSQYRHQLIISDRINGDMFIEDEFARDDNPDMSQREHLLRLAPLTLQKFDIDIVEFDDRMRENQENDASEDSKGVTTGMALYKYVLPKRYTKTTQDHFANKLSDPNWLDADKDNMAKLIPYIERGEFPSFLTLFNFTTDDSPYGATYQRYLDDSVKTWCSDIYLNQQNKYTFTNAKVVEEFDDVLGKLELASDEYVNEDGNKVEDNFADVYIWDDLKFPYYPCNGKEYLPATTIGPGNLRYYLKDIDRMFQKLTEGIRVVKLVEHAGAAKKVPLGVWRYRFVWDFGDGVYSLPSAEMIAPDVMWSAMRDGDLIKDQVGTEAAGEYERFRDYAKEYDDYFKKELFGQFSIQKELYVDSVGGIPVEARISPTIMYPPLFSSFDSLTTLGEKVFDVKYKLYKEMTHKYGTKEWAAVANFNAERSIKDKGDFGVLITCKFPEKEVACEGFIWEGVAVAFGGQIWKNAYNNGSPPEYMSNPMDEIPDTGANAIKQMGKLVVPIFQGNESFSYNSVFDDEGRLRLTYKTKPGENYANDLYPTYQIVFPGGNDAVGMASRGDPSNPPDTIFDNITPLFSVLFSQYGAGTTVPDLYFNIVSVINPGDTKTITTSLHTGGIEVTLDSCDANNDPSNSSLTDYRPQTIIRGVKKEEEKLSWTRQDVPNEAKERLILSGTCELELCKFDDRIYFETQAEILYETTGTFQYLFRYNPYLAADDFLFVSLAPPMIVEGRGICRKKRGITVRYGAPNAAPRTPYYYNPLPGVNETYRYADNISVVIYGESERFVGIEQLTSYFPSSLLFGAPRMGIKIHSDQIPKRAKRLLIYRTKSTHSNDWQPNEYGLVKAIELRKSIENVLAQKYNDEFETLDYIDDNGDKVSFPGLYFFDDVKDKDLDFGQSELGFEGLNNALKSRFSIALNERLYYANFIETFRLLAPRAFGWNTNQGANIGTHIFNTNVTVLNNEVALGGDGTGYRETLRATYLYAYITGYPKSSEADKDQIVNPLNAGIISPAKQFYVDVVINGTPTVPRIVVLYFMPSGFDNTIAKLKVYRHKSTEGQDENGNLNFYYIGDVNFDDEGIFVDNDLPAGAKYEDKSEVTNNFESGIRWSEPYRADWIKAESFLEAKSGDGKQITGIASNYGNLVVFKETSMHRYAVQASEVPISRVDELEPDIGCIAPNTLINIDNTLYFLSWKGFMMYNNNVFKKIDGLFDEELQFVLRHVDVEFLRDATCGYNPHFNELYLNIPMLPSLVQELLANDLEDRYVLQRQQDWGKGLMYQSNADNEKPQFFNRALLGHIYVINLDKGYATKFCYQTTVPDPLTETGAGTETYNRLLKEAIDQRQLIRMYYTNSLGELRSADILPNRYGVSSAKIGNDPLSYLWAGFYTETPYKRDNNEPLLKDTDEILDGDAAISARDYYDSYFDGSGENFPPVKNVPIKSYFKSKFFTGNSESLIKRVRKVLFNMFTRGPLTIKSVSIPEAGESGISADERIENDNRYAADEQEYNFEPSITLMHPLTGVQHTGTGSNNLTIVPRSPQLQQPNSIPPELDKWNDWLGKPIRYSVEIESELRTQINSVVIHWRPINTFLH